MMGVNRDPTGFSKIRLRSKTYSGIDGVIVLDGGFSGGNTDRPALQQLLDDIRACKVDVVKVYNVCGRLPINVRVA